MTNDITITITAEQANLINAALKAYSNQLNDRYAQLRANLPTADSIRDEMDAILYGADYEARIRQDMRETNETAAKATSLANDIACAAITARYAK